MQGRSRLLEQPVQVQTPGHRMLFGCRSGGGVCHTLYAILMYANAHLQYGGLWGVYVLSWGSYVLSCVLGQFWVIILNVSVC